MAETVEVFRVVTDVALVLDGATVVVEATVTGFAVVLAGLIVLTVADCVVAFTVVGLDADVFGDMVVVVVVVTAVVVLTIDGGRVVVEETITTPHDAHGIDFVASAHVGVD